MTLRGLSSVHTSTEVKWDVEGRTDGQTPVVHNRVLVPRERTSSRREGLTGRTPEDRTNWWTCQHFRLGL